MALDALRKAVFDAVSGDPRRSVRESSDPVIHKLLRPFDGTAFPTIQVQDFSRVQKSAGWPNTNAILGRLERLPSVTRASGKRVSRNRLAKLVDEALEFRAARSYAEEWRAHSNEVIREVVASTGGLPNQANAFNGAEVAGAIRRTLSKQARARVMDIGTGGGSTILPVLQALSPSERARVDVVLQDIMPAGLSRARNALLGKPVETFENGAWVRSRLLDHGLKPSQIKIIQCNLFDFQLIDPRVEAPPGYTGKRAELRKLVGKVDVVTSFAAIHHMRNSEPFLRGVYRLVKPGGRFIHGDWGHFARAGRTIGLHEEHMNRSVQVTRGKAPTPAHTAKAMNEAWLSLFWAKPQMGAQLKRDMQAAKRAGRPFNFLQWIKKNEKLIRANRDKAKFARATRTGAKPAFCMEGHEPLQNRVANMRTAGFRVTDYHFPFYKSPRQKGVAGLLYHVNAHKPHQSHRR